MVKLPAPEGEAAVTVAAGPAAVTNNEAHGETLGQFRALKEDPTTRSAGPPVDLRFHLASRFVPHFHPRPPLPGRPARARLSSSPITAAAAAGRGPAAAGLHRGCRCGRPARPPALESAGAARAELDAVAPAASPIPAPHLEPLLLSAGFRGLLPWSRSPPPRLAGLRLKPSEAGAGALPKRLLSGVPTGRLPPSPRLFLVVSDGGGRVAPPGCGRAWALWRLVRAPYGRGRARHTHPPLPSRPRPRGPRRARTRLLGVRASPPPRAPGARWTPGRRAQQGRPG